jgi:hypothetical protein
MNLGRTEILGQAAAPHADFAMTLFDVGTSVGGRSHIVGRRSNPWFYPAGGAL